MSSSHCILIDTSQRVPVPPGIFAIWDGMGLVAERVEHEPNSDPPMGKKQPQVRRRRGFARPSRAKLGHRKAGRTRFSIPDTWSRQLLIALCRRYGLNLYRHRRMHRQAILVRAPKSFVVQVLWPEFQELSMALQTHLSEITERVIREEVHRETRDAEEGDKPARIGR